MKSFTAGLSSQCATKAHHIFHHNMCVAILPCEIQDINIATCFWLWRDLTSASEACYGRMCHWSMSIRCFQSLQLEMPIVIISHIRNRHYLNIRVSYHMFKVWWEIWLRFCWVQQWKNFENWPTFTKVENESWVVYVFIARCTLVQSAVLRSHVVSLSVCLSVRLSVCDVGELWSHRLEFFENNFTIS